MKCHGAEASAQADKEFKEKPDDKKIKGAVTSGPGLAQLNFRFLKRN